MAKSDGEHAARMLAMAAVDLAALEHMGDPASFPEQVFGFHAQQAIEKALKAWIAFLGLEYPKSHDLITLVRILDAAGQDLQEYPRLEDYTAFAVQYRYEAYDRKDDDLDRGKTLALVRKLVSDVAELTRAGFADRSS